MSAAQARRTRLIYLGGLVAAVAAAIVIVIVATGGGSKNKPQSSTVATATVSTLLGGIPESGNTLGDPKAPVTITEYGDLVCPICRDFALGSEQQLIQNEVRAGKVKLVFRGLETASGQANNGEYAASQIAARAAGRQNREWYYILLWYHEQGDETTPYVTDAYMQNLAQQVPGLSLTQWQADRNNAALASAVNADTQAGNANHFTSTPSFSFSGVKGTVPGISGIPSYAGLKGVVKSLG